MKRRSKRSSSSRSARRVLPFLLLLIFAGCRDTVSEPPSDTPDEHPTNPGTPPDEETVAVFGEDGRITLDNIDEVILSLQERARTPSKTSFADWYDGIVQQHLLNQIILEEARRNGIDDLPEFLRDARILRRQLYSDFRLRSALQSSPPITKEEIEARYQKEKPNLVRPEIRRTYHIFLRFPHENETKEEIIARLNQYRDRVKQGENFGLLASQFSESESRARQGKIGDLKEGDLPEPANSTVFSIDEGEVSDPVVVEGGAHLFYVENTVAKKTPSLEESRPFIEQAISRERVHDTLSSLAESCELPENHLAPSVEEWKQLVKNGNPETVLFALGTYELQLSEYLQAVAAVRRGASDTPGAAPPPLAIYEDIKHREIIFQDTLTDQKAPREKLEEVFRKRRDNLLLTIAKRRLSVAWLNRRTDLLEPFYHNNEKRFRTVPRVHLAGLNLPISSTASEDMRKLETTRDKLATGEVEWEALASDLGADYSDWGWFEPAELAEKFPRAATIAFGMAEGEVAAPYSKGESLRMFTVLEQEKPRVIPFEVSKTKVIDHYLAANGPEVFQQLTDELLKSYNAAVFPENFPDPLDVVPSTSE